MRMRLGLLHDADAQQRMHEREQRAAEEKKRKAETPTVRTELEQRKHDEQAATAQSEGAEKKKEEDKKTRVKIRPLSEARAIELGANFFSEAFIFAVAAGLLVWDSWRSRAKESARRDDVADRIEQLEAEVYKLRREHDPELAELKERMERIPQYSWYNPRGWFSRDEPRGEAEPPVALSDKSVREMVQKGESASQMTSQTRPAKSAEPDKSTSPPEKPAESRPA